MIWIHKKIKKNTALLTLREKEISAKIVVLRLFLLLRLFLPSLLKLLQKFAILWFGVHPKFLQLSNKCSVSFLVKRAVKKGRFS